MLVTQLPKEHDQLADETSEALAPPRFDGAGHHTERLRHGVGSHRQLGDDPEGAASPSPQRPEEVGMPVGVRHEDLAVCGHDLDLQDVAGSGPVSP